MNSADLLLHVHKKIICDYCIARKVWLKDKNTVHKTSIREIH